MRAFVLTGPREAAVHEVPEPVAGPGQVVVDVARVGVCGTDVEFFTGEMAYLHSGHAEYPLRLGHEWCGTVSALGAGVDRRWVDRRVTGDTMLGCGMCERCTSGHQHVCADRHEIGIRRGWPGALAELLVVPASALHLLPDTLDDTAGALVEPGGNSWRAIEAARADRDRRVLIWGSGTIGLLALQLAVARGAHVDVVGRDPRTLALARDLGARRAGAAEEVIGGPYDAVIDATNDRDVPAAAVEVVEPGGRVVFVGLSGEPSYVDTRMVALKDVTVVGILSASPGLTSVIDEYASGRVDPRPVVAATVGLSATADVLRGHRPSDAGVGPKMHIDPRKD
jgi:2-desacetyl-2-hydroxyethyl bacteriochlorophyllide A dehydrogenase